MNLSSKEHPTENCMRIRLNYKLFWEEITFLNKLLVFISILILKVSWYSCKIYLVIYISCTAAFNMLIFYLVCCISVYLKKYNWSVVCACLCVPVCEGHGADVHAYQPGQGLGVGVIVASQHESFSLQFF